MLSLCPVTSWRKGWAWKLANCFLQSPRRLIRPLGPLWFSHHQVALVVKNPPANAGDLRDEDSIPGLGRSPGEGNSNPLQYSCLENPIDRGTWWATVHGVTKSQTQLKQLSSNKWKGCCRTRQFSQHFLYAFSEFQFPSLNSLIKLICISSHWKMVTFGIRESY